MGHVLLLVALIILFISGMHLPDAIFLPIAISQKYLLVESMLHVGLLIVNISLQPAAVPQKFLFGMLSMDTVSCCIMGILLSSHLFFHWHGRPMAALLLPPI